MRGLEAADWERLGQTADRGVFTIASFVDAWARHDAEHIASLESALGETLAEVKERRARREER